MQVICCDNFWQPLLEEGKEYSVRELNLKRHVIVVHELAFEFPLECFLYDPDIQDEHLKDQQVQVLYTD